MVGGGQENNLRSGTYNLPGIMGLTFALELAYKESCLFKTSEGFARLFWQRINQEISGLKINGSMTKRIPANLNVQFTSIEGEAILMDLSHKGICVSTGSACSAANLQASHVLTAIGLSKNLLNSNIRFSFGRFNTKAEINYTIKALKETVKRLRSFSPIK